MTKNQEAIRTLVTQKTEDLHKAGYLPPSLLQLVEAVYIKQLEAQTHEKLLFKKEYISAKDMRVQGAPILPRKYFPYDQKQATGLFYDFLLLLQKQEEQTKAAGLKIAKALEKETLTINSAFIAFLNEDEEYFIKAKALTPQAPQTLHFLTQASLSPSFTAAAKNLCKAHETKEIWEYHHCPVCGSLPLLAELRDSGGAKYLFCSFCHTSYRTARLGCTFCGEKESTNFSFFAAHEEPGYAVEACNSCMMYLKIIDFRKMDKKILPLMDDLASLPLDFLIAEKGYKRPTPSGFGF